MKRISLEVNAEMLTVIEDLEKRSGLNRADLFRYSLGLMKMALDARDGLQKLMVVPEVGKAREVVLPDPK
jgi:hypothetical protein